MPETISIVRPDGRLRTLADIEAEVIRLALARTHNNISDTAKRLGIGRSTIYRYLYRTDLVA